MPRKTKGILPEVKEVVEHLAEQKDADKCIKFFLYKANGVSTKEAEKLSGYSHGSGYRLLSKYRNNAKFREKIDQKANIFTDWYRTMAKLSLATVEDIEEKALQEYQRDPRLAISKPQLLRQKKQAAGIQFDEAPAPVQQTVNIKAMQVMIKQALEEDRDGDSDGVVDLPKVVGTGSLDSDE